MKSLMSIKNIITTTAILFFNRSSNFNISASSLRGLQNDATSSLPLVPIDSFFDNINGDWTKDGEKRVHMSRSPSSATCTLNGESGPYPFGEYYCHRESTKTSDFCKSGPNDYCKCWIFPVCLKSNGKNCSKNNGRHQGCHVLIERPTGYKNTIIQDKLSKTEWEIYNYSPDLSF